MANPTHDRLRTHFAALPPTSQASGWDSLWAEGTFTPWDRGFANPALIDYLAHPLSPPLSTAPNPTPGAPSVGTLDGQAMALPPPLKDDGTRRKALIPGCGKGYDVALLASYGYDAYGLEVSTHAAERAREYLKEAAEGGLEGENRVKDGGVGRGVMECLCGDFFEGGWLAETGEDIIGEGGFDVIYDNTFLCALPPSLRPAWAERTSALLAPDGLLVCLEFPTHKPAASQGPPWSLPPTVHLELLKRPGEDIGYDDAGVVVATQRAESEDALVRVGHWTPRRTHDVAVIKGVVRDCVSVWKHRAVSA
ncbi:S-adenosyl-L-methionine-dependent methyltransferase [Ophiobolus disseminans]|uniref:S-adenosyl-L-methionine-dependent methyltransferase n=1 Tax=Ophiobolus disseminans TaxID=1469910 RepID=A0A6A7AJ04_9PLEO|nr:S-adenosyl-L-methionine-dependent methyltransferase [Ophiobolus disseminans]